jgi:hypothetical protein
MGDLSLNCLGLSYTGMGLRSTDRVARRRLTLTVVDFANAATLMLAIVSVGLAVTAAHPLWAVLKMIFAEFATCFPVFDIRTRRLIVTHVDERVESPASFDDYGTASRHNYCRH